MPSLRPKMAFTAGGGVASFGAAASAGLSAGASFVCSGFCSAMVLSLELDLHVDAGRQVEAHHLLDGLRRRLQDVDQPLVDVHLELLPRLLVRMDRTVHGVFLDLR